MFYISEEKYRELREESILKSAVYSARIEGNPITFEEAKLFSPYFRRKEIVRIIEEHPYATFDFLSRRFSKVNPKTLHYDLKELMNDKFIEKIGKTRGVSYIAKK
jgi:predicted HTH transcriptional regulator